MKILLEGIDGTGKSTLAKNLARELGIPVIKHLGKPKAIKRYKGDKVKYQKDVFRRFNKTLNSDVKVVYDRAHLGEFVYGPLYRGEACMRMDEIEQGFKEQEIYLILLVTNDLTLLRDDGENFNTDNQCKEQEMFKAAFRKSKITRKAIIEIDCNGKFKLERDIIKEAIMKARIKSNGKRRYIPRTAHAVADADYLDKLSPTELEWYLNAEEVLYDCDFSNPLANNLSQESKEDLNDEAQSRRRCVLSRGLTNFYEERQDYENLIDSSETNDVVELAKLGVREAFDAIEAEYADMVFAGLMDQTDADFAIHQAKNEIMADEKKMQAKKYSKLTKAELKAKQRDMK